MKKALLIVPPSPKNRFCVRDKGAMGYSKAGYIFPPYDLAMIAATLRESNVSVKIIDANAKMLSLKEVKNIIAIENPQYLIFNNSTPTIDWDLNIAKLTKLVNSSVTTITFGPHISIFAKEVLESCPELDIAVINEQELTIREIIESGTESVKGTAIRKNGEVLVNDIHEPLKIMDDLPFPAHDLLELKLYKLPYAKKYPCSATMTSRGCPYRCIFCATALISKKFLPRSPDHVLRELHFLTERCNVHELKIWDDTFTLDRKRVIEICERIISEEIDLNWTCNTRIDKIDKELLTKMKEAGCHTISLGVESGDDVVLKSTGKQVTTNQIREGFKITKEIGIETVGFFMFGHPNDTVETMQKTIDFAKELNPDYASFNIATPFPGTPLFELAKKNGWLKTENWTEYESTSYPVYESPNATCEEVYKMFEKAYKEYYFRQRYIFKRLVSIRSLHDLRRDVGSALGLIKMMKAGDNLRLGIFNSVNAPDKVKYGSKSFAMNFVVKRFQSNLLDFIYSIYNRNDRFTVLDIGCGLGVISNLIAQNFPNAEITSFDIEMDYVNFAKKLSPNLRFYQASAYNIPESDSSFDLVLCLEMLEYIQDPHRVLREIMRVAKKHLIVSVPNGWEYRLANIARGKYIQKLGNPGDIHQWNRRSFNKLLLNYFVIKECKHILRIWVMCLLET